MSKPSVRKVIDALGGNTRVAVALGLSPYAVIGWAVRNRIPHRYREALRGLATANAAIVDQGTVDDANCVPNLIPNVAEFIRAHGGAYHVAVSMGCSPQAVYSWMRGNRVPAARQQTLLDLAANKCVSQ